MSEKQIFLYKRSVKPSRKLLSELEGAGFICIPVGVLDDVRVVNTFNFLDQSGTFLLRSAWEAIEQSSFDDARKKFGTKVLAEIKRQLFADAGLSPNKNSKA